MNESSNSSATESTTGPRPGTQRRTRTGLLAAGLLGIGIVVGAVAGTAFDASANGNFFRDSHGYGGYGGYGSRGGHGPEAMKGHMQDRVSRVLDWLDATETQTTQVSEIAEQVLADVAPLIEQHRSHKRDLLTEFSSSVVNEQVIEDLRVAEIEVATEISLRLTEAIGQVSTVLTPEQRAKLAEKMSHRRRR